MQPIGLRTRMSQHIDDLCKRHDIHVVERRRYGGIAYRRTRTIAIMPVRSQRTYVVALHEIGHIVGRRGRTRLEEEGLAWDWALVSTVVPLSASTYARILNYLDSYLARAARRKRMVVPSANHPFWDVYRSVQSAATQFE